MGFLDSLLGRTKAVPPDLDALFALPSAALTLQAATGLAPTGDGGVAVKRAEGGEFARTADEVDELLQFTDDVVVEHETDTYGYLWTVCRSGDRLVQDLVTALHAANSTWEARGFGPGLLCSYVEFAGEVDGRSRLVVLVYLYKRGTFYPFAPLRGQRRDQALELAVRARLDGELPVEPDLQRWFPIWDAPGVGL